MDDKSFWTYAKLEPCDVIAHSGYGVALSHAVLQQITQDEWGRWINGKFLITRHTRKVEEEFIILEGGNYDVEYDETKILH